MKLRSHKMKSLFHHCIAFASSASNEGKVVAQEADLLKRGFTLDALLLK